MHLGCLRTASTKMIAKGINRMFDFGIGDCRRAVESRQAPRYPMRLPVELLFDDGARLRVLTRDISASGLFIMVDRNTSLHDPVRFLITFPREITTSCELYTLCDGAIVRREPLEDSDGIAIRIRRYQFLSLSN